MLLFIILLCGQPELVPTFVLCHIWQPIFWKRDSSCIVWFLFIMVSHCKTWLLWVSLSLCTENGSLFTFNWVRKKIILIEGKAKCRHIEQFTCKGTLRQVFIRVYRLEIDVGIFNPALGICTLLCCLLHRVSKRLDRYLCTSYFALFSNSREERHSLFTHSSDIEQTSCLYSWEKISAKISPVQSASCLKIPPLIPRGW